MTLYSFTRTGRFASAAGAVALVAACVDGGITQPDVTPAFNTGDGGVAAARVTVCKHGTSPAGTYEFTVSQAGGRGGSLLAGSPVLVAAGACVDVWEALPDPPSADPLVTVTATEVNLPAGIQLDSVVVALEGQSPQKVTGPAASALVNFYHGAVITFYNSLIPSGGGEGCTPGFWRQTQHLALWPTPYAPATPFGSVFEDAFPGKTLLQVVKLGGGGLNGLGRHTVAALLNAQAGLDYPFTAAEVIAAFNAVFPGGDYNGLARQFDEANNLGCPFN